MKRICVIILVALAACSSEKSYDPSTYLDLKEQSDFVTKIIRYAGKRPEKSNDTTKFDAKFNEHYNQEQARHTLKLYYESSSGEKYFLLTRRAPSIYEKFVALGGKVKFDNDNAISEYEEVFRTWKLVPDTLNRRATMLFDKMVKGESLEPYLTKNSAPEEYIEFPDDNVYFDKESRKWKSKQYGSVEEMVQP